jgi:hypothetical protein
MRRYPDIVANFQQPMTAAEAARVSAERNKLAGEERRAKDREHARAQAGGKRPAPAWTGNLERLAVQGAIARSRRAAMPAAQRARIDGELARAAGIIAREKSNAPTTTAGVPTLAEEIYAAKNRPGRVDTINERYGRVSRGGVA